MHDFRNPTSRNNFFFLNREKKVCAEKAVALAAVEEVNWKCQYFRMNFHRNILKIKITLYGKKRERCEITFIGYHTILLSDLQLFLQQSATWDRETQNRSGKLESGEEKSENPQTSLNNCEIPLHMNVEASDSHNAHDCMMIRHEFSREWEAGWASISILLATCNVVWGGKWAFIFFYAWE